ncbi:four-carbon acid sugar kinase family protein [Mesorhizobium hawassense]|uniref:Four-carbon acid sugar kinase family protein n=1 Tax=Mesorhizobium hawassense TaxID=1209954 RepID=A0A330HT60_9HYPH|nr:four-carbon acid sugar kinase family protein [Mesorhizobium hawassense]RAZ90960.1 four-carbon acid sugar kinase family protein [Mesorhizobium hawassense]
MQDLLLSYYGDDLTGSTDVMEALELGGVPTVLFMRKPDDGLMARFAHCRAVGLAGTSRSESPQWMDTHLTEAFAWLKLLQAEICHYKVCSTFDSSPTIGSIGRAIEIGRAVFAQDCVPLVVGAPQLKRYTAFGHLFAAYRDRYYRIDRHPVMSRHPATPMDESDLLVHLSRQTDLPSELLDLATLRSPGRSAAFDKLTTDSSILLVDVDSPESQALAGKEIWRARKPVGFFVVGSSGIEYALLPEWQESAASGASTRFKPPGSADRIAVVSGSCSPTTERQIRHAMSDGFDGIEVDPIELVSEGSDTAIARAAAAGKASLEAGRSAILYTALGPAADRGAEIDRQEGARHKLGRGLGELLRALTVEQKLKRVIIAGGDTSSHALGQMGVDALTVKMPLPASPGSPLCVAHSSIAAVDGLEVALKGGQVGTDRYFSAIRDGLGG